MSEVSLGEWLAAVIIVGVFIAVIVNIFRKKW